jgi:hypothetical protein
MKSTISSDYTKTMAIDELLSIQDRLDKFINVVNNRDHMDNNTKLKIRDLYNKFMLIYDHEMDKELKKQKNEGKKFLTDDEIDNVINNVINNELKK